MKKMKKLLSVVMALAMMMSLAVAASAAEVKTGTIKITNAAEGATYEFYKLFDAKVGENGAIAYTGDIPTGLDKYFDKDGFGQVTAGVDIINADMKADLLKWAKAQTTPTATANGTKAQAGVSVPYGYYVIVSNVGDGTAVTVNSTNPDVEVIDKNTTKTPVWPDAAKKVNDKVEDVVQMGQTATYTVTLKTVNWVPGENGDDPAVKVVEYTISDDFAGDNKLTNVKVTKIEIGDTTITGDDAQFASGKIVLPWVNGENEENAGESKYPEGVNIVITYTATVNATGEIKNTVKATYKTLDNETHIISNDPSATVYNSTITIDKYEKNNKDNKLPGAKFILKNSEGKYYNVKDNVVSWGTEAEATVVTTLDDGSAKFEGLVDDTYTLIETEAPAGYNKLIAGKDVPVTAGTAHTVNYTGEVENSKGIELPDTGGMGTTIFTVVGGMLMVGAAVLFVTKKRSED